MIEQIEAIYNQKETACYHCEDPLIRMELANERIQLLIARELNTQWSTTEIPSQFNLNSWREFCFSELMPRSKTIDLHGEIPDEIWRRICDFGFLKIFHPQEYPDYKISSSDLYQAMEILARANASCFWKTMISSALCGKMISEIGTPSIRERWIPKIAMGEVVGCFAATETGSGSDPSSYQARLECVEGQWILNGKKSRISNAIESSVCAMLVNSPTGLAMVFTDLNKSNPKREKFSSMGLRALSWGSLQFEHTYIPSEEIVDGVTMGRTLHIVEWGQVIQAMCAIGLATEALAKAKAFTAERKSFGKSLSVFPVVAHKIGQAETELAGAKALLKKVVSIKSENGLAGELVVAGKIFATEMAVRACETSMRVCGGWGYTTELEIERMLRDAYGNIPAGLPNDRLRELMICPRIGIDPWKRD